MPTRDTVFAASVCPVGPVLDKALEASSMPESERQNLRAALNPQSGSPATQAFAILARSGCIIEVRANPGGTRKLGICADVVASALSSSPLGEFTDEALTEFLSGNSKDEQWLVRFRPQTESSQADFEILLKLAKEAVKKVEGEVSKELLARALPVPSHPPALEAVQMDGKSWICWGSPFSSPPRPEDEFLGIASALVEEDPSPSLWWFWNRPNSGMPTPPQIPSAAKGSTSANAAIRQAFEAQEKLVSGLGPVFTKLSTNEGKMKVTTAVSIKDTLWSRLTGWERELDIPSLPNSILSLAVSIPEDGAAFEQVVDAIASQASLSVLSSALPAAQKEEPEQAEKNVAARLASARTAARESLASRKKGLGPQVSALLWQASNQSDNLAFWSILSESQVSAPAPADLPPLSALSMFGLSASSAQSLDCRQGFVAFALESTGANGAVVGSSESPRAVFVASSMGATYSALEAPSATKKQGLAYASLNLPSAAAKMRSSHASTAAPMKSVIDWMSRMGVLTLHVARAGNETILATVEANLPTAPTVSE